MHTHCIDKKSELIQRFASNFDNFNNEIWNNLDQGNVVLINTGTCRCNSIHIIYLKYGTGILVPLLKYFLF